MQYSHATMQWCNNVFERFQFFLILSLHQGYFNSMLKQCLRSIYLFDEGGDITDIQTGHIYEYYRRWIGDDPAWRGGSGRASLRSGLHALPPAMPLRSASGIKLAVCEAYYAVRVTFSIKKFYYELRHLPQNVQTVVAFYWLYMLVLVQAG